MTRASLKDSRGLRAFMVERAIFEREDLTAHEKLVLCYLAMRANSESECWPSYNTIARECSISRRQAMRVVGGLEEKGLLAKSSRSNDLGRFTSNLFRLFSAENPVFPPWQNDAAGDGDCESPSTWCGDTESLGGDSAALGGDSAALGVVQESHLYEQDQEERLHPTGAVRVEAASQVDPALEAEAERVLAAAQAQGKRIANPHAYRSAVLRSLQETAAVPQQSLNASIVATLPPLEQGEGFVCATCEGLGFIETDLLGDTMRTCPACRG